MNSKRPDVKRLLVVSSVVWRNGESLSNGTLDAFIIDGENLVAGVKENNSTATIKNAIKRAKQLLTERRNLTI